jgi:hypothetical protein
MSTSSDVAELSDNSVYLMAQVGGNSIVECAERCCHANGYNDIERDLYCTWFAYFLFRIPTNFFQKPTRIFLAVGAFYRWFRSGF